MSNQEFNNKPSRKDTPFVCSWSGGKDSCLALWQAIEFGGVPKLLLTMLDEHGERSRSHGLLIQVLQAQADSMGIPLKTACATWNDYEAVFISALTAAAKDGIQGVEHYVDALGRDFRHALFLTGCKNVEELKNTSVILGARLREWVDQRDLGG